MTITNEIVGVLQQTAKLKTDLFESISNALEDINKTNLEAEKIPNSDDTISGTQARLTGFCALAEQVTQDSTNSTLVSYDYLRLFKESIQALNTAQSTILTQLLNIENQGGVGNIDANYVLSNKANSVQYPLGQGLTNLINSIDRGLERYYLISPAITRTDVIALSNFTRELEPILTELKQAKANAKRDATYVAKTASEINTLCENANEISVQISKLLTATSEHEKNAAASLKTTDTILSEANAKLAPIQEISDQANKLKISVEKYQENFDKFDKEIESRIRSSQEGEGVLKLLMMSFKTERNKFQEYSNEKKNEVERLISRAEKMLGISTSAGLGDTFKQQAARRGKAISILYTIITISLIGIAAITIWIFGGNVSELKILFRYSAIIPLGILVSILTVTLRRLEQSREYYEHKESVSQAVEGYRKLFDGTENDNNDRADLIKQTIKEVLKNPADSLSKNSDEDSNIWKQFDKLLARFSKLTDIGKKSIDK